MIDQKYKRIADHFGLDGELICTQILDSGHINDTILLKYLSDGEENAYVLQKINKYVFHHPDELMQNMVGVTEHIRKKVVEAGGNPEREVLTVLRAAGDETYYLDEEGEYWRLTKHIKDTVTHDVVSSKEEFYTAGKAFGKFQSQLSDYPADTLFETIPKFHDTRDRYKTFEKSVSEDKAGRAAKSADDIKFFTDRKELAGCLMDELEAGALPLRVTHNDTKFNNVLLDTKTGEAICVIDLDTVMPGLAVIDFGDATRCGACTAAEDEKDVRKVKLDLEYFEAYTKGFIEECAGRLTEHEIDLLPLGTKVISYELAMRFLTDYLDGDLYFKTDYSDHNLVRAHTQMQMVCEIENHWEELQSIVKKYKQK